LRLDTNKLVLEGVLVNTDVFKPIDDAHKLEAIDGPCGELATVDRLIERSRGELTRPRTIARGEGRRNGLEIPREACNLLGRPLAMQPGQPSMVKEASPMSAPFLSPQSIEEVTVQVVAIDVT